MIEPRKGEQTATMEPEPGGGESKSLSWLVARLAGVIEKEMGAGDVAVLRRLRPEDPASPVFWKVMASYVRENWSLPVNGPSLDDAERRWACLLSALARTKGLHTHTIGYGKGLAEADYSELRFVRLLHAEGKALFKEIELAAEFLNSKAQRANWAQVAEILFTGDEEKTESLRRRISRDYYKALNAKENK